MWGVLCVRGLGAVGVRGVAVVAVFAGLWGCQVPSGGRWTFDPSDPSVVMFLVDGLNRSVLESMLRDGELEHIERRFVRGGVTVDHAIASLPTMTYPNAVSLLTGRFPGHHGIVGNRWFDRDRMRLVDYMSAAMYRAVDGDFSAATLHEVLGDRFTANVQCQTRRGATVSFDNAITNGLNWLFGFYSDEDRRAGTGFREVVDAAVREREWPAAVVVYLPGVDEVGHRDGPASSRYRDAIRVVDETIGRIIDDVASVGMADSTYFVLVSDHGLVSTDAERSVDIVSWLQKQCGLRVHSVGSASGETAFKLGEADAVVINGAYRRLVIHLRGRGGWSSTPSRREVDAVLHPTGVEPSAVGVDLVDLPGVGQVCTRGDDGGIVIRSAAGSVAVERRIVSGRRRYRMVSAADSGDVVASAAAILGYDSAGLRAFVGSGWHTSREWLAATASAGRPDFVPQIMEMFDSRRAGDVVVFASDGWSFGHHGRGSHGSNGSRDMRVPLYFAGPGLPPGGHVRSARTVDVMPTVVGLLGAERDLDDVGALDGVSIVEELRSADVAGDALRVDVAVGVAGDDR